MIPRRVYEHVKAHNWFAVAIDFFIVVVGVFVGLQVNNWNETRQSRERGAAYSERLTKELRTEYEYGLALQEYYNDVFEAGEIAHAGLTTPGSVDDETSLINAYRASQYNWYESRRAAYDEIISSGALDLIANPALRETAIIHYNMPVFTSLREEAQESRYRELFRVAIDPSVYRAVGESCGDKESAGVAGGVGILSLAYGCALSMDDDKIAEAVAALRREPEILRELRLRNAKASERAAEIELSLRNAGLTALFETEADQ